MVSLAPRSPSSIAPSSSSSSSEWDDFASEGAAPGLSAPYPSSSTSIQQSGSRSAAADPLQFPQSIAAADDRPAAFDGGVDGHGPGTGAAEPASCRAMMCYSLILACCFTAFSGYTVLTKVAISGGTAPIVLAFFREVIAASLLLPYGYYITRRDNARAAASASAPPLRPFVPKKQDWGSFILLGIVMVYGVQVLSALSLRHVTPLNYSLLAPTVPPLNLAFSLLFGFEAFSRTSRTSWMKLAGIVIAVAGGVTTALTAAAHEPPAGANVPLGNALLLCNKVCIGLYPLLEKHMLRTYHPVVIVAWGYVSGALVTLLALIPSFSDGALSLKISPVGWVAIAYAGCVSSAANYSIMAWVNSKTSPVFMMMHYPIQSFATPLIAFVFLGSTVTANDAIGGVVIVIGLGICLYAKALEGGAVGGGGKHAELRDDDSSAKSNNLFQKPPQQTAVAAASSATALASAAPLEAIIANVQPVGARTSSGFAQLRDDDEAAVAAAVPPARTVAALAEQGEWGVR